MSKEKQHSIRRQVTSIFFVELLVYLIMIVGIYFFVLIPGLNELEERDAFLYAQRVQNTVRYDLDLMERTAEDWGAWNDTYDYIQGLNPSFVDSNLYAETFINLNMHYALFYTLDKTLLYGLAIDPDTQSEEVVSENMLSVITSVTFIETSRVSGLINTPLGPLMLVVQPITNNDSTAPTRGYLVFGRYLNATHIETLSEITTIPFTLTENTSKILGMALTPLDSSLLRVELPIDDMFGETSMVYTLLLNRDVRLISTRTIQYGFYLLVLSFLAFIVFFMLYMERQIIGNLTKMNQEIDTISSDPTFKGRLSLYAKNNEFKSMTDKLNMLLENLDHAQAENLKLIMLDHLTGLPNRAAFDEMLTKIIKDQPKSSFAVMFLDLDGFKAVNDSLGHKMGDTLLIEVASRLKTVLQPSDIVARMGGDEFLILVRSFQGRRTMEKVANDILMLFDDGFTVDNAYTRVTTSIGVAMYPTHGTSADVLIKNADLAMYKSKDQGKNRFEVFTNEMQENVLYETTLTNDLYQALENNELRLHYQPQIDTMTQCIVGVEALLTWVHPILGRISPAIFIPIAEKTGLINLIGEWVLKKACQQTMMWQYTALTDVTVACNISSNQFTSHRILDQLNDALEQSKVDPSKLTIEITETVVMNATEEVIKVLNEIKKRGVRIALDDFGTGFSSLNYIKDLPIDIIKIAMPFIQDIKDPKKKAIISAIIKLAKELNLKVIAEGVETEEQYNFLVSQECDIIQGYYFHKSMPADQLMDLMIEEEL